VPFLSALVYDDALYKSTITLLYPQNTWFLGPTRLSPPNGISIGSVVFAGLTNVTNRQTDRPTTLLRL